MSVTTVSIIAFVLLLSDRLIESEIYVLSWFLGYIPILTFAPQRSELDLCGVEEVVSSCQVYLFPMHKIADTYLTCQHIEMCRFSDSDPNWIGQALQYIRSKFHSRLICRSGTWVYLLWLIVAKCPTFLERSTCFSLCYGVNHDLLHYSVEKSK